MGRCSKFFVFWLIGCLPSLIGQVHLLFHFMDDFVCALYLICIKSYIMPFIGWGHGWSWYIQGWRHVCLNVFCFRSFIGLWHVCNFLNIQYDLGLLLFIKDWYCIVVRLVWVFGHGRFGIMRWSLFGGGILSFLIFIYDCQFSRLLTCVKCLNHGSLQCIFCISILVIMVSWW